MPYTNIHYSLVATTFNDAKTILQYLDNIMQLTYLPLEIVIADGGSKDNTLELIEEYSKSSRIPIIVISGARLNISEGYNAAIRACSLDIIGITGVGNRYEKDYFKLLCQEMETTGSDLVYGKICGVNTTKFSQKYNNTFLNNEQGQVLSIASNHGVLIKKKVFEELKYFYDKFIYAGEDTEFYSLALKKGYKTICVKSAIVYWETPATIKEFLKQIKNYLIGNMQIYSKKEFLHVYRAQFKRLGLFILALSFICLCIGIRVPLIGFAFIIIALITLCSIVKKAKPSNSKLYLLLIKDCMILFYMIKYRKYMQDIYQVKR